jgi:hypothetical protein
MRRYRLIAILTLLALSLGSVSVRPPIARALGAWVPAASPTEVPSLNWRGLGTPVLLSDGRVLLTAGTLAGRGEPWQITTAIFDPTSDRWSARATASLNGGNGAPVLLPDGRVLFSGGSVPGPSPSSVQLLNAAQLYDPASDTWSPVAPLAIQRAGHTATLLQDGTVLIVGGLTNFRSTTVPEVERYDPRTNRWSPAGQLTTGRWEHTATLLRDGRVLVVGGRPDILSYGAPAELYDPATNSWGTAGQMVALRGGAHQATPLADGTVLVTGGYTSRPDAYAEVRPQATAERYDPERNRWTLVAPMSSPRNAHSATSLSNGWVLVAGGYAEWPSSLSLPAGLGSAELYDPAQDLWATAAPLTAPRTGHAAIPLPDGRVLALGGLDAPSAELYTPDPSPSACFAETGQCVRGRFLEYWQQNGGLARNGFPLSPVRVETLEDGRAYQVQYFERVRLEYHPENAPPYDVLLGQFGRRVLRTGASPIDTSPATPLPGQVYFPETGHNLGDRFLEYWRQEGGLAQFGYPLTEVFEQNLEDGRRYRVQYFERARFEAHPENARPYDVLLGQFGRQILTENLTLSAYPGFQRLFVTNERVQTQVGFVAPARVTSAPGAYQAFERGAMIYRGDVRGIYVLCGDAAAGRVYSWGPRGAPYFPDPWREGEEPGGGQGPAPGLYEPRFGFGKLWRESPGVRACLGYATDPDGTAYTIRTSGHARGYLINAATPQGRFIYSLYISGVERLYERYPDPSA